MTNFVVDKTPTEEGNVALHIYAFSAGLHLRPDESGLNICNYKSKCQHIPVEELKMMAENGREKIIVELEQDYDYLDVDNSANWFKQFSIFVDGGISAQTRIALRNWWAPDGDLWDVLNPFVRTVTTSDGTVWKLHMPDSVNLLLSVDTMIPSFETLYDWEPRGPLKGKTFFPDKCELQFDSTVLACFDIEE